MNFGLLSRNISITPKKILTSSFLTSGTLAWFFLLQVYLADILSVITPDIIWVDFGRLLFYGFGVFSALAGSLLIKRMNQKKFLLVWILFGFISTISLNVFQGTMFFIVSCILLGFSLGLGLPASMTFITESTTIDERGRIFGITILETFVMAFLIIAILRMIGEGLINLIFTISIIRLVSLFVLLFDKSKKALRNEKQKLPKSAYKEFAYYLFPWIMFTLAAGFAWNLIPQETYESVISIGTVFRYALIAIFGLVWGVVADRVGRKQPIIIGLILLGVSFALLGSSMNETTVLIYLLSSGIAWASFLTIFQIIPGDLSVTGYREKFYAFGTIAPLIILFAFSMIDPTIYFTQSINAFLTQILSIILFISIIPVLRAKETLSESKIQTRKIKEYTDKLGEIIKESKE